MAAVVDDHVERARLELRRDRANLVRLRLVADEGREPVVVKVREIGQINAGHLAEREIALPQRDRGHVRLVALGEPAAQPDLHQSSQRKPPRRQQPVIDPGITVVVAGVAVLVGVEAVGEVGQAREIAERVGQQRDQRGALAARQRVGARVPEMDAEHPLVAEIIGQARRAAGRTGRARSSRSG